MDKPVQVQYKGRNTTAMLYFYRMPSRGRSCAALSATVFFVGARDPQLFHQLIASTRLALREAKPMMNLALSELARVQVGARYTPLLHLFVGLLSLW